MRRTLFVLPTLLLSGVAGAQIAANPAAAHVGALLANDARDVLRDPDLPPEIAAKQAAILLQFSTKLDPDVRALRLLAEASRVAGMEGARREALRAVIAADPGDLVSQVHYIELLAGESQTLDARAALYQNALAQNALDAQIRSEVAVRLARLAEDRGDAAQARDYLTQAVRLNDVNIGALRELVRFAATDNDADASARHLKLLVALLVANPYQPDAWMQVAQICRAAGVHDRANEFMQAAGEQMSINGALPDGEFYLDMALEQAAAGQRGKALGLSNDLSVLGDAPLAALLIAELLAQDNPPLRVAPSGSTQPAFDRAQEIRRRLTELAKNTTSAAALADAAGADLTIMARAGADTPAWIEAYAKLVDPEDVTLARLKGWLLYRQGKPAEARAVLQKIADADPMAQVGLAKIMIDQGKSSDAGALLQKVWNNNPTGLLALQVSVAAAKGKIELADSPAAKQMRAAITRLSPGLSAMHRQPRDLMLISTTFKRETITVGDAVMLQMRIANTSDRALPVGPEGMVKTTMGLAAVARGSSAQNLGIYAIEDVQRTYRLEPRQSMDATFRVDQGKLADLLEMNPGSAFIVNVTAVSAPRILGAQQYGAGVGGMAVAAGDFQRGKIPLDSEADMARLFQEITAMTADKQLVRIEALGMLLNKKPADIRPDLWNALKPLVSSGDPLVRTVALRAMPTLPMGFDFDKTLEAMASDSEPLVRLTWASRAARMALAKESGAAAKAALEKQAAAEKDPLVGEWIATLLKEVTSAATAPATTAAPASEPAK